MEKGNNLIHSKIYALCCCADAPARAGMQNRIKFNGYSGCGLCLIGPPWQGSGESQGKYPFDVVDYAERTMTTSLK